MWDRDGKAKGFKKLVLTLKYKFYNENCKKKYILKENLFRKNLNFQLRKIFIVKTQ